MNKQYQFDFLIQRRPVSLQTRNRSNLHAWKAFVQSEAAKYWKGQPLSSDTLHLTVVYLFESYPVDTDNIIKPIQDALIGLVYLDDTLIIDVESHRRSLFGTFDITRCPSLLVNGILSGKECVYVRVKHSISLEDYL